MTPTDVLTHLHDLVPADQPIHQLVLGLAALALLVMLATGGTRSWRRPGTRRHSALYTSYMASPQWAAKRQEVRRRAGGRCEQCRRRPGVQAHHVTYAHLGHERASDVRWLCVACHQSHHAHSITGRPAGKGCALMGAWRSWSWWGWWSGSKKRA